MDAARRRDLYLMIALFSGSLALRAAIAGVSGFDGLYGQDAYAYYDCAEALRSGRLPVFFWPLGYPMLLAASFTLFGTSAATAQAISLIGGALVVVLMYVLARQIGMDTGGSLLAALLVAFCGQAIQSSLVVMADMPAMLWATASAVLLLRYLTTEHRWLLASAFGLLALACVTRWLYLALFPAWILALMAARRRDIRHWLLAIVTSAVVIIPQLVYSATTPFPTFSHAWVQGWSPANALSRRFTNVDGMFLYPEINLVHYAHVAAHAYYLAPVFTPFIVVGLWALWRRQRAEALLLAGWMLFPYLFLIGIPYQNVRFPLAAFPAVAVLAGLGAQTVYSSARLTQRTRTAGTVAVFGIGFALSIQATSATLGGFLKQQRDDQTAAAWATEHIPPDATLYAFGLTLRMQHITTLDVRELYYETPQSLRRVWTTGQTQYLLLNTWVIENQWQGRELQRAYHWLRDVRGLEEVGRSGAYRLFRIR